MEILEKPLERVPGLVLVFGLLAVFMLGNDSEAAAAIRVFVVAWVLYRMGSYLDGLFDVLYRPGPEPPLVGFGKGTASQAGEKLGFVSEYRFTTIPFRGWPSDHDSFPSLFSCADKGYGRRAKICRFLLKVSYPVRTRWYRVRRRLLPCYGTLEDFRWMAALGVNNGKVKGVYTRAKQVLGKEQWEAEVAPALNISKLARTLVVPLLVVLVVKTMPTPQRLWVFLSGVGDQPLFAPFRVDFNCAHDKLGFLYVLDFRGVPVVAAVLCLVSFCLYFSLRIRHMNRLYKLATRKLL
jgi:hypothetical protein